MECTVCGHPLPLSKGVGRPRKVCSARCHQWKARHGDARPSWLDERRCIRCDVLIESNDIRVRYCSESCRRLHTTGSHVGTSRACRYCDEPFEVTNGKQVYCSKACRIKYNHRFGSASNLRRQAKKRGALLEGRFTLLDVAMRDGWVCALCLSLVDPNVKDRRLQATVDHITPIAAGGTHSFANAQLAHWVCNSAKRDRTDVITMSVPSSSERVIIRGRIGGAAEVT